MKIFVAHASDFDFANKLYAPLRASALSTEHDITLPQEKGKEVITKDTIKNSDVFVAEVSLPSTGAGIEMGWASAFNVPIICLYEQGSKPSGSIKYVAKETIEYTNSEDMLSKLTSALGQI